MARFNRHTFLKTFNPPRGTYPIVAFAIGREDKDAPRTKEDEERLAHSRTRIELSEILFFNSFC